MEIQKIKMEDYRFGVKFNNLEMEEQNWETGRNKI
jgi:hypothetical protein